MHLRSKLWKYPYFGLSLSFSFRTENSEVLPWPWWNKYETWFLYCRFSFLLLTITSLFPSCLFLSFSSYCASPCSFWAFFPQVILYHPLTCSLFHPLPTKVKCVVPLPVNPGISWFSSIPPLPRASWFSQVPYSLIFSQYLTACYHLLF